MTKINYIISAETEYQKLICNDAGPEYAKTMQWPILDIKQLSTLNQDEIYVIDNRISERECETLHALILASPSITFVAKIVDPYIENYSHFYYQWVGRVVTQKNVRLLSVYEPKELTFFLSKLDVRNIIHVPYVYDENKELSLQNLKSRKNKVIISGSIDSLTYPYRTEIWRSTRRASSRIFYDVLRHPGYVEINDTKHIHTFIGPDFVSYLSAYKFMLTCGSRCEIEFLKFHECAYAGCIPVGEFPTSFPTEIKELFRSINTKNIFWDTKKLLNTWDEQHHIKILNQYRAYLKDTRSVAKLNHSFINQL